MKKLTPQQEMLRRRITRTAALPPRESPPISMRRPRAIVEEDGSLRKPGRRVRPHDQAIY